MSNDDDVQNDNVDLHSDVAHEQVELRDDIDLVRRYGEAHPDAWVGHWFENQPTVRIVAEFAGTEVDEHEATLRALVAHPDKLEVRRSDRYPRAHLDGIAASIRELATTTEREAFQSWGIGRGRLNVVLRASRSDLAQVLLDTYGDAVELRVGFFSYPDPMMIDTDVAQRATPVTERPPLLPASELRLSLERALEVQSGETLHGVLHVDNIGPNELVIMTNGAVTARIVDPQTGASVGGYEFAQSAVGVPYRVTSGGGVDITLLVGTASANPLLGYCVPPGHWAIEVPLTLEGRGVFRSPLMPIVVVP